MSTTEREEIIKAITTKVKESNAVDHLKEDGVTAFLCNVFISEKDSEFDINDWLYADAFYDCEGLDQSGNVFNIDDLNINHIHALTEEEIRVKMSMVEGINYTCEDAVESLMEFANFMYETPTGEYWLFSTEMWENI